MTLTEFLTARLDEDEAVARAARPSEHLRTRDVGSLAVVEDDGYSTCSITSGRVLREVEAKRRIVTLAEEATGLDLSVDGDRRVGRRDVVDEPYLGDVILRALAAVYSDHPAYDEAWRQ